MNWNVILNVLGSALAAGLTGFLATKQGGATDEQAGIAAGTAVLTALVQHFRQSPTAPAPAK